MLPLNILIEWLLVSLFLKKYYSLFVKKCTGVANLSSILQNEVFCYSIKNAQFKAYNFLGKFRVTYFFCLILFTYENARGISLSLSLSLDLKLKRILKLPFLDCNDKFQGCAYWDSCIYWILSKVLMGLANFLFF